MKARVAECGNEIAGNWVLIAVNGQVSIAKSHANIDKTENITQRQ